MLQSDSSSTHAGVTRTRTGKLVRQQRPDDGGHHDARLVVAVRARVPNRRRGVHLGAGEHPSVRHRAAMRAPAPLGAAHASR